MNLYNKRKLQIYVLNSLIINIDKIISIDYKIQKLPFP